VALLVSVGNFALFDLRHEYLISKSVFGLLSGSKGYYGSFWQSCSATYFMFIGSMMNILGLPSMVTTQIVLWVVIIILFITLKKNKFYPVLLAWLLVPNIILMMLRHGVLEQLFVFLAVGAILGVSIGIDNIQKKFCPELGILVLFLLIYSNLLLWFTCLPTNTRLFFQSTQPQLRYKDQQSVIDYVYEKADGKPFFFQSYTIPYFWQDGWEYLFWQKGTKKNRVLPDEKQDDLLYVIIQKDRSNPRFQADWYEKTVRSWGALQNTASFGEFTIEERKK
jgi:hypothetical protein